MADKTIAGAPMAAGVCTVLAGLTLNDVAIITGIVVTVGTFIANLWFQWDKRKREISSQKGS